jgi:hypothetical protein
MPWISGNALTGSAQVMKTGYFSRYIKCTPV